MFGDGGDMIKCLMAIIKFYTKKKGCRFKSSRDGFIEFEDMIRPPRML
jgi:hypothetical protein